MHYSNFITMETEDRSIYTSLLGEAEAQFLAGNLEKAGEIVTIAADLDPSDPQNYSNLGMIRMMQGLYAEALSACKECVKRNPNDPRIVANMAGIYIKQGQPEIALPLLKKAREMEPLDEKNHNDFLFSLHCASIQEDALFLEHRRFGLLFEKGQTEKVILPPHHTVHEKIRLGYILADIPEHAVWHILRAIVPNHDRDRFEIYLYWVNGPSNKSVAEISTSANVWREVSGSNNETLATIVKGDAIDILFDLSGHTGGNRLPIFAARSAPIQISWFGYMDTSGLMNMDYRITDEFRVPRGREHLYTENLVYLPESYAFDPTMTPAPEERELPLTRNGHVTFGSFNTVKKLNHNVLGLWGRILHSLPDAKLIMVVDPSREHQEKIVSILEESGAKREQIRIVDTLPLPHFLMLLRQEIDIALDTYPYSGGATVLHTLSQGVPSLTLCGRTEFERNGSAIMASMGLNSCIANSPDEYVQKAILLSKDVEALTKIRKEVPDEVGKKNKDVVKNLEKALLTLVEKHRGVA